MNPRDARRFALAACLGVLILTPACTRSALPASLGDADFWTVIETLSEPAGKFDLSENLVSNEPMFVENVRRLRRAGGVYVGVGPEQNFSYIARARPEMAFIVDIRRENLNLHLLYKALFELANDRADFVSLLFSRPRPPGLGRSSSVDDVFQAFETAAPSRTQMEQTVALVRDRLTITRRLPLAEADLAQISRVIDAFFSDGPAIHFWRAKPVDAEAIRPSYAQLMTARDATGERRSYLASEDDFAFIKALHTKNLVVPVVGDFGGAKTLRGIGEYVRQHGGAIGAFYASNVNVYLTRQQSRAFCANLATLPARTGSSFVDRETVQPVSARLKSCQ